MEKFIITKQYFNFRYCSKGVLLVLLFLISLHPCKSQPSNLDSLKLLIEQPIEDEYKYVDLLNDISYNYYKENIDSSIYYAQKALMTAKEIDHSNGVAYANVHLGYSYFKKSQHKKANKHLNNAIIIFNNTNNSEGLAKTYNIHGIGAFSQGEYDTAMFYFKKAAVQHELNNDKLGLAKTYNNMGIICKKYGNLIEALRYYEKSLNIEKELDYKLGVSELYNNIANIYSDLDDFESSLEHYNKSFAIKEELGLKSGMAKLSNNIGSLYLENNYPEKAYYYIKLSIKLKDEMGDKNSLPNSYNSLGEYFILIEKYDSAEYFLKKVIKLSKDNSKDAFAYAHCYLASLYWELEDYQESLEFSKEAYKLGKDLRDGKLVLKSSQLLVQNYQIKKDYKNAYKFLDEHSVISDSLSNDNIIRKTTAFKYEQENLIMEHELDKQNLIIDKKKQQVKLTIAISLLIIGISLLGLFDYLKLKNKNKILFKKNLELAKAGKKIAEQNANSFTGKEVQNKINPTKDKQLLDKLNLILKNDKYFTNKNLTLDSLSEKMDTNRSYLSRLINEQYKCNFSRLINEYRIKEAQTLLIDPKYQNYTIEGIADLVGFRSKSAFNTAFKEFTGITPSFYKNEALSITT